jgi:hypothetical protein
MQINYKILSADNVAKILEVEYTSADYPEVPPVRLGFHVPVVDGQFLAGDALSQAIVDFCPVGFFERVTVPNAASLDLTSLVGSTGTNTPTPTDPSEQQDPLVQAKEAKFRELAAWRYAMEVRGVNLGGVTVRTDRESQATLANALLSMREGFVAEVDWKAANGWAKVSAPQMAAIARAVSQHVQQSFACERMLVEQVEAATTVEQVRAVVPPPVICAPPVPPSE